MNKSLKTFQLCKQYRGWYSENPRSRYPDSLDIPNEIYISQSDRREYHWISCGREKTYDDDYIYGVMQTSSTNGWRNISSKQYFSVFKRRKDEKILQS
jgi:hypothetical protein